MPTSDDTLSLPEIGAKRKTGTIKTVLVSEAPDMQFDTEFFWYQFLAMNRTSDFHPSSHTQNNLHVDKSMR